MKNENDEMVEKVEQIGEWHEIALNRFSFFSVFKVLHNFGSIYV